MRPLPEAALAAAGAWALALCVPVLLLSGSGDGRLSLASLVVCGIVLYAAIRLATIAVSGQARIVSLTFWVFVYVYFGLCPLLQLSMGVFPLGGRSESELLVRTALIVLAGLAAFDLGQRFAAPWLASAAVPLVFQRRLCKPTVVLATIASLAIAAVLLPRLGGIEALFLTRVERQELLADRLESSELLLLTQLVRAPVFAVLIAALAIWMHARRCGVSVGFGWKTMCVVLLIASLVINNPISTPRLMVGTLVLSLFFVLPWRRFYGVLAAAGLVTGLIFVFPLADAFRVSLHVSLGDQWEAASPTRTLNRSMDFDAFQQTANTVALVDRAGPESGRQLAGTVLFAVPRVLWADKPLATGQMVAEKSGYAFTNLSAPLWAEFYVDGGLLLVILGFLAYGAFVGTLDQWSHRNMAAEGARVVSVLIPIYAAYQFFLLRGSLMPAVAFLTPIVIFATLCSVRLSILPNVHGDLQRTDAQQS